MRLVKGKDLTGAQREEVWRTYAMRHLDTTCRSDEEWLRKHAFYVRKDGHLASRPSHCEPEYVADIDNGEAEPTRRRK